MKKTTLKALLAIICIAVVNVGNVLAQVPAHGSIKGAAQLYFIDDAGTFYPQGQTSAYKVNGTAHLHYKLVVIDGKTFAKWQPGNATAVVTSGGFWPDGILSAIRYYNGGALVSESTFASGGGVPNIIYPSATISTTGVTQLGFRAQANVTGNAGGENNGTNWTDYIPFNPAAYNSTTGEAVKPVFPEPGKVVTATSIAITLNATDDSGDLYYYIVDKNGNTEVIFDGAVTYTFPATEPDQTYTIYAIDFSGNVSDPQVVETISSTATKLSTPTGLVLNTDKKSLTFTEDANASSYLVLIMDENDEVIFEQSNFTSGDEFKYLLAGDFTINLGAVGDGVTYSNSDFAQIAWGVTAGDINLVTDVQYCNSLFNPTGGNGIAGDEDAAYLVWEMAGNNIEITIIPYFLVGGVNQTEFRGTGINTPANITVNGDANTGNKYFIVATQTNGGLANKVILTPQTTIPVGSHICYANGYIVYKTVVDAATSTGLGLGGALHDLYPNTPYTTDLPYIYGSACASTPTAVSQLEISEISLASTFVNDVLIINGLTGNEEIKVINALGALINSQNTNGEINVAELPSGIYILLVKDKSFKFIKK